MKNKILYRFRSKIRLKITGRHAEKFIHKLIKNKIEILNMNFKQKDVIYIWIYKENYPKLCNLKTIYDIDIIDAAGWIKVKKTIGLNKYFLFSLLLGIMLLFFLTNIIFSIQVVHTNKEIRDFILQELKQYEIESYRFKKKFSEIETIKQNILDKYKDKIEWLEIEEVGIKYVVRIQLRELVIPKEEVNYRDVIAKKDATIKKIVAQNGQVVKEINSYVKKGDTIISGTISLNDNPKGLVAAEGTVYGEVWYQTTIEYPFVYYEEKYTRNERKNIAFTFLNWSLEIPFKKHQNKKIEEKVLWKSNLLPIKLTYQNQKEIEVIDQVLTEEETIKKAMDLAKDKMERELEDEEYIISQKNLKINVRNSKIELETFFVVYENITDYKEIKQTIEPEIE